MTDNPQLLSIFCEARERRSPEERAAYLDEACGTDAALRERVEELFGAERDIGNFLQGEGSQPKLPVTVDGPQTERPGTRIGPYKLMEQIGEGGMGLVFVAEQQHPVRRKVALKVIKPGMDTRQVIARFEAERQALALMDHPNIAKVLDGGETPSGRPYFVMELVKGVPITEFCDENQIPVRARLELFLDVCHAVQHAHQKGIIHRDIKPSNVLVMFNDGTPLVKVIDFGVAKAVGQQLTDKTIYTQFTQLVGTPLYMSPEQAGQSGKDIDTRTDIYALGVLLYELLTGTTPFEKERFKEADYEEMRRIIREEEPPKPSTRISTLGQAASTLSTKRKSDSKRLCKLFRGELDWIVMKAIEKDRNRRYESASAFAEDVQRYLEDEPVLACPPSVAYRLRKWLRKHRAAAGIGLALVLVSLALVVNNLMIRREQARTQSANERLRDNLKLALEALDETLQTLEVRLPQDTEAAQDNEKLLTKALGFYERFAERNQDDPTVRLEVIEAYLRASDVYYFLGRIGKAETALSPAAMIAAQMIADFPSDPRPKWLLARVHLGKGLVLYESQGPTTASGDEYHKGIALLEPLVDDAALELGYRNTLADLHSGLAWSLNNSGKLLEAEKHGRQAIKARSRIVNEADELARRLAYMQSLAMDHNTLGNVLSDALRLDDAEDEYREQIRLLMEVDAQGTKLPGYRQGLVSKLTSSLVYRGVGSAQMAAAHNNLGKTLRQKGRSGAAAKEYSQAAELFTRAIRDWPRDAKMQRDLAVIEGNLGQIWFEEGKRAEATKQFQKAIDSLHRLAAQAPGVSEYQYRLEDVLLAMGDLLHAEGDHHKAAAHYRELQNVLEELAARSPDVAWYLKDLAWFLVACADRAFHNPTRALALAQQAVALSPENADILNTLGMAQYRDGRWQAAVVSLNKARQLHQEHAEGDWLFLAMAHWKLGDKKLARACYDRAVELLKRYEYPPTEGARWQAEAAALLCLRPE